VAEQGGPAFVIEGLDDLLSKANGDYLITVPGRHLMKAAGAALRQASQREAPKGRTKKLSRSHVEVYGSGDPPAWVRIENTDQPKATFVALGTRAHRIVPNRKKALFWPGAAHPVKSVWHPGTKPNDWLVRAQVAADAEINGPIRAAFDEEVVARWEKKGGA
jgi:hypothetical protein